MTKYVDSFLSHHIPKQEGRKPTYQRLERHDQASSQFDSPYMEQDQQGEWVKEHLING